MENRFLIGLDDEQRQAPLAVRRHNRKVFVANRVTTLLGDTAALIVHGPGDFFGEQALLSCSARTADLVAPDAVETMTRGTHESRSCDWRTRASTATACRKRIYSLLEEYTP